MSSSIKVQVWSLIVRYRNGNERVEHVSHEEFGPFDFSIRDFDAENGGDVMDLRIVEHSIEVPLTSRPVAEEKAVWQEDRYRVRILHCGDYSQDCCAISRRMSLHEAAKLACDWKTLDDGYIDILPPTDPECQPIRNRGEPEAIATEQPAEAATEAA